MLENTCKNHKLKYFYEFIEYLFNNNKITNINDIIIRWFNHPINNREYIEIPVSYLYGNYIKINNTKIYSYNFNYDNIHTIRRYEKNIEQDKKTKIKQLYTTKYKDKYFDFYSKLNKKNIYNENIHRKIYYHSSYLSNNNNIKISPLTTCSFCNNIGISSYNHSLNSISEYEYHDMIFNECLYGCKNNKLDCGCITNNNFYCYCNNMCYNHYQIIIKYDLDINNINLIEELNKYNTECIYNYINKEKKYDEINYTFITTFYINKLYLYKICELYNIPNQIEEIILNYF